MSKEVELVIAGIVPSEEQADALYSSALSGEAFAIVDEIVNGPIGSLKKLKTLQSANEKLKAEVDALQKAFATITSVQQVASPAQPIVHKEPSKPLERLADIAPIKTQPTEEVIATPKPKAGGPLIPGRKLRRNTE